MTNKIVFLAESKEEFEICPKPMPTAQFLPDWWKNGKSYLPSPSDPKGKQIKVFKGESTAQMKKCTPMRDFLTSGYIIPLWSDVSIEQDENEFNIKWNGNRPVFKEHAPSEVEIPDGYNHMAKYSNPWTPKLPKGYSVLVIPPIGYANGPFRVVPAIIDADKYPVALTPPCFIKSDFNGIVEKGTPMIQLIPFKRDNWKAEYQYMEPGELDIYINRDVKATLINNYVKNFWERKSYQ
jgi:hypothetical protein